MTEITNVNVAAILEHMLSQSGWTQCTSRVAANHQLG